MHAVYYVRPGENEELRYSLRSVAANSSVDRVSIIGGYPEWLNTDTVEVLPGNPFEDKHRNGLYNISTAAREFPGDFVVFNDDFMVLRPMPENLPYFHKQSLDNHFHQVDTRTAEGKQRKQMMAAMSIYLKKEVTPTPLSFETHIPMRINGSILHERMNAYYDWWEYKDAVPLVWRSLYANQEPFSKIEGRRDVITHGVASLEMAKDFASTADRTVGTLLPLLQERFPEPSIWEKS